jgi:hypothetical protein
MVEWERWIEMDITKASIGQEIRAASGRRGKIVRIDRVGDVLIEKDDGLCFIATIERIEPIVPDTCESCEMATVITNQCKQIADSRAELARLSTERDNWKFVAQTNIRNAKYGREELSKLQKEALSISRIEELAEPLRPISEVAKIYIQINSAVLAKIIVEWGEQSNGVGEM